MFICKICNKECKSLRSLLMHFKFSHSELVVKDIYDMHYRSDPGEEICTCGKQTSFYIFGYKKFCSRSCASKAANAITKQRLFERYGVINPSQVPGVPDKVKATKESKYGDPSYNNHEKAKDTCIKRYNCDNVSKVKEVKEKSRKTCFDRLGVEYPMQSETVREKSRKTCKERYDTEFYSQTKDWSEKTRATKTKHWGADHEMKNKEYANDWLQKIIDKHNGGVPVSSTSQIPFVRELIDAAMFERFGCKSPFGNKKFYEKYKKNFKEKHGVEHQMQIREVFERQQRHAHKSKKYKDTDLNYRGNNELDFLEKYIEKIDIKNGPTVRYIHNGEEHIYYPDYYIESKNLIIEIKSCYTYAADLEKNLAKQKACIEQGYDFIFVIDKNYEILNEKL